MGNARAAGCALVLFVSLVVSASSVSGQSCTPVVYVFRHAEDTNPPEDPAKNQFHPPKGDVPLFALTPTGNAHAALYPTMINDLQAAKAYCPVTRVYATTTEPKANPDGDKCDPNCISATNAFFTAQPLARAMMSGADPIITVNQQKLYEYLGNGNGSTPRTPLNYFTPTADALRGTLLDTARRSESSAIFWTSQGMHVLGGVIIDKDSNVNKDSKVPEKAGWMMPPRNSVYIFVYSGSQDRFDDTPTTDGRATPALNASVWVQCFNHIEATNQVSSTDPNLNGKDPKFIDPAGGKQRYYCGFDYQSSVGGKPWDGCAVGAKCGSICTDTEPCDGKSDKDIKGKICDTRSMLPDTKGTGIFGACEQ